MTNFASTAGADRSSGVAADFPVRWLTCRRALSLEGSNVLVHFTLHFCI